MLEAIGNTDPEHVLSKLVIEADQTSVQRDLKAQRISVDDNALGVPVERYLLDAMRRLLASSQWLVNQRDARVWIRKSNQSTNLYLVWKSAAKEIIELLVKTRYLAFQEIPIPLRTSSLSEDLPLNPPQMSDMKALPLKC